MASLETKGVDTAEASHAKIKSKRVVSLGFSAWGTATAGVQPAAIGNRHQNNDLIGPGSIGDRDGDGVEMVE
jgi:hypothetical protein